MIRIPKMFHQVMLHTIILVLKVSIVHTTECVMNLDHCVFTEVFTTASNLHFNPKYVESEDEVQNVLFINSNLYALTYELCNAFLNLNRIDASNVIMEHISSDSFRNCSNLAQLILPNNKLSELHFYLYPVLKSLTYVDVENNFLFDFDEKELLYKFPNLRSFLLSGNQINCDRLRSIIAAFKKENVEYHKVSPVQNFQETNKSEHVDGINCVTKKHHIMDLIKRYLQEFVNAEIEEILKEIAKDVENLNLQQSYINSTVFEITEYIEEAFVPLEESFSIAEEDVSNHSTNILNITENIGESIKEIDAKKILAIINERNINSLEKDTDKLSDSISKLQEEINENCIEIRQVKYSIKTKFESSQQLYYISLALLICIIIVAIATITIVMNIFYS